jgi:hypothetical protein
MSDHDPGWDRLARESRLADEWPDETDPSGYRRPRQAPRGDRGYLSPPRRGGPPPRRAAPPDRRAGPPARRAAPPDHTAGPPARRYPGPSGNGASSAPSDYPPQRPYRSGYPSRSAASARSPSWDDPQTQPGYRSRSGGYPPAGYPPTERHSPPAGYPPSERYSPPGGYPPTERHSPPAGYPPSQRQSPPAGYPPAQLYSPPPDAFADPWGYPEQSEYESDLYQDQPPYTPGPGLPGRRNTPADDARRARRDARHDRFRRDLEDARDGFPLGVGTFVGVVGLGCLLLALTVLPWFRAGGEDVTRSDLQAALGIPEASADDLVPDPSDVVPTSVPDGVPSPGEVGAAVEEQARDEASEVADAAISEGRRRYIEAYTDVGWIAVAGGALVAVTFSTMLTPSSGLLSLLVGVRFLAGAAVAVAGVAHGVALWVVFGGDGAPSPAIGVWIGVGGLAAVMLSCALGPRR